MADWIGVDMAQRTCTIDGCDRKHVARGLCSTHYNKTRYTADQRHPTVEVACGYCGTACRKRRGERRFAAQFCSLVCRDLWRVDQPDDPMWKLQNYPRRPLGPATPTVCMLPKDHPAMWVGSVSPLAEAGCRVCGLVFVHHPKQRRVFCSRKCSERARTARRRGRKSIRRMEIFERDGFICWICERPTTRVYAHTDLDSPTVDHLVPRSLGGTDDPDNLATAHLICNSLRGTSWELPRIGVAA